MALAENTRPVMTLMAAEISGTIETTKAASVSMPVARMAKNTTTASTAPEKILKRMIYLPFQKGKIQITPSV
jgi:hypothetical protein